MRLKADSELDDHHSEAEARTAAAATSQTISQPISQSVSCLLICIARLSPFIRPDRAS